MQGSGGKVISSDGAEVLNGVYVEIEINNCNKGYLARRSDLIVHISAASRKARSFL